MKSGWEGSTWGGPRPQHCLILCNVYRIFSTLFQRMTHKAESDVLRAVWQSCEEVQTLPKLTSYLLNYEKIQKGDYKASTTLGYLLMALLRRLIVFVSGSE